jgi:hypothetical protein
MAGGGFGTSTKTRVNTLFLVHAGVMACLGAFAMVFPEVAVYLLHTDGAWHGE